MSVLFIQQLLKTLWKSRSVGVLRLCSNITSCLLVFIDLPNGVIHKFCLPCYSKKRGLILLLPAFPVSLDSSTVLFALLLSLGKIHSLPLNLSKPDCYLFQFSTKAQAVCGKAAGQRQNCSDLCLETMGQAENHSDPFTSLCESLKQVCGSALVYREHTVHNIFASPCSNMLQAWIIHDVMNELL